MNFHHTNFLWPSISETFFFMKRLIHSPHRFHETGWWGCPFSDFRTVCEPITAVTACNHDMYESAECLSTKLPAPDLKFSGYFWRTHWFEGLQSMLKWCWMMSSLWRKGSVKVLPVLAVHPPHDVLPLWKRHGGTTRSDNLRYLQCSGSRFVQLKASTKTY